MKKRHRSREIAFQLLYQADLSQFQEAPAAADLQRYFEHFQVPVACREFALQLYYGVLQKREALDQKIQSTSSNWKLHRMGAVDRSILRMALYELQHLPDTPVAVILNEAIEIAKSYGAEESAQFINGILDAICKQNLQAYG